MIDSEAIKSKVNVSTFLTNTNSVAASVSRNEGVNYFVYSLSLSKIIGLFNFEKMLIKQIKVVALSLLLSILFPFLITNIPSK